MTTSDDKMSATVKWINTNGKLRYTTASFDGSALTVTNDKYYEFKDDKLS